METIEVIYKTKIATENEILVHLRGCNANFYPLLTERVNIEEYSRKIFERSVTFEAWSGEFLVGLVAAYFNESPGRSVFITNVSILKGFMGVGIASRLMENSIRYAYSKKFREIKLDVYKENRHAIGLYKKYGFTIDGIEEEFLKMKMELIAQSQ